MFVGLGFFAKQGEVLLIIPALLVLLAVVSPRSWKVKLGQSLATVVAMVVSAGWYIVAVALWPSSSRPYIGGSTNNFIWDLTLGITDSAGSVVTVVPPAMAQVAFPVMAQVKGVVRFPTPLRALLLLSTTVWLRLEALGRGYHAARRIPRRRRSWWRDVFW